MGSFNVNCSVTRKTIGYGDDMVIQFLVPSWARDYETGSAQIENAELGIHMFVSQVKLHGIEKAVEMFTEVKKEKERQTDFLASKGVIVSNDSALMKWIPFGPSIRGTYGDYGGIKLSCDVENQKRIEILRSMLYEIPFSSIVEAATDDRWWTYGICQNKANWKAEGLDKKLGEDALRVLKNLSLTYIHSSVYDELKHFDFSSDNGKLKNKYDIKWKEEYILGGKEELRKILHHIANPIPVKDNETQEEKAIRFISEMNYTTATNAVPMIKTMSRKVRDQYIQRLSHVQERTDFEWLYESMCVTYAMTGLGIELSQSMYGSQERNWKGWERIERSLNPAIKKRLKEMEDDSK